MGVYTKGFPLTNNCGACPLRLAWCRERIYMVTRPERCPLVPVPEHGRLIDADALITKVTDAAIKQPEIADVYYEQASEIGGWLYSMPTIIPADKDGE